MASLTPSTQVLLDKAGADKAAVEAATQDDNDKQQGLNVARLAAAHADEVLQQTKDTALKSAHDAIVGVATDLGFPLPAGF